MPQTRLHYIKAEYMFLKQPFIFVLLCHQVLCWAFYGTKPIELERKFRGYNRIVLEFSRPHYFKITLCGTPKPFLNIWKKSMRIFSTKSFQEMLFRSTEQGSEFDSLRNFSQSCEFAMRIWSPAQSRSFREREASST